MMKLVNALLAIGVIVAGYFLFRTIQEPIQFNSAKEKRISATIEKLTYIKDLQIAFKDVHKHFSPSFDSLAIFVAQDTFKFTKVIGDPDELDVYGKPIPVSYEHYNVLVKDSLTNEKFPLNELANIPMVSGESFSIATSTVERGRIIVPVYEVVATHEQILSGLKSKYINKEKVLKIGSLDEPNYNGNW